MFAVGGAFPLEASAEDDTSGFLKIKASGEYVDLPVERAIITPSRIPFGETDGKFWGVNIEVTGAFALPAYSAEGRNTRLEITGKYADADTDVSTNTLDELGFVPMDLSASAFGTVSGPGIVKTAVFDTSLKRFGVDVIVVAEREGATVKSSAIFAGLTYFKSELENEFSVLEGGVKRLDLFLRDDIETDYAGVLVGANAAVPLGSRVDFTFGGRAELLYAEADLEASQSVVGLPVFVTDSDDDFAGRLQGEIGLAYNADSMVLAVVAEGTYLSYQPYGYYPTDDAPGADVPAQIADDELWTYAVGASVKYLFW